ncbi:hypothetical protein BCV69DRAFT_88668 [Microstroma glucosiphilum]|uniref:Uncharacterized protein n=1 Tax=Pseudomicrostroma glucosiphilum TaxID=1684307 RepID=A0A316TZ15_9BASI|nr:hypothetical protein BCV69DRAFT_88668 [Pseudomicrostroma glucosiphilum]PWN17928.1 hypothetical protein BCV69DRAFT_88668 [Pseudomicrostroma glucosiphilum]
MVASFAPSLLPMPSAAHSSKEAHHVSPVGYAVAAARRLSNALPYQWQYSFDKNSASLSSTNGGFSNVDLSGEVKPLPQWYGQEQNREPVPSQLCPGGFPSARGFEDEVRFDPLDTTPSLLPSHCSSLRPMSSNSSLSDLSEYSCNTADVLSLAPGSLLLDLHNCRDASRLGAAHAQYEPQYPVQDLRSEEPSFPLASTSSSSKVQSRRKSFPRRFLGTSLERSPRQLSLFSWSTASGFDSNPATPELQAPGWKQVDYFSPPCPTTLEGKEGLSNSDSEGEYSDDEGACFTAAQIDQICQPFDRRPSHVAELESLRPSGGVGLEGRARAMSAP